MSSSSARLLSALALVSVLAPGTASAQLQGSLTAPQHVDEARKDAKYTFCTAPKIPLSRRDRELCPMAAGIEGCAGFVAACNSAAAAEAPREKIDKTSTWRRIMSALGVVAQALVWVLIAGAVAAIAIPLVLALLRARRDKALADAPVRVNVAVAAGRPPPPPPEAISDAEAALREADDHARRGELARALSLYLAASLAALDRRGAIRLARHRTNGEYVRSCAEDAARQPLREIIREVDRVEFGKLPPTGEAVAQVGLRARSVVRAATTVLTALVALVMMGCSSPGPSPHASSPSGDELPIDVLRRAGYDASHLATALSALPVPGPKDVAPVVVVDTTRVALEEESTAHLLHWVDEGGVLVVFGPVETWPAELHASPAVAAGDDVEVLAADVYARGARVGTPRALAWPDSEGIAFTGKSVYAAHIRRGKGGVVGVAGRELVTNVGVSRPDNAGVFVGLIDVALEDRNLTGEARGIVGGSAPTVRFARAEDGIPPPSNPFSALVQAGLGKGAWHALAAALVLFLCFGIRHARPRPATVASRRAFAEHVQATGTFYGRAGALSHALASYGRFAELRLRERLPRGSDPVTFLAARASVDPATAERLWSRATKASSDDPTRGDELTTIRDLGALLAKALR